MKKDHAGVYIPPPLIYVATFMLSILLQKWVPIHTEWFDEPIATISGWAFIALAVLLILPAIRRFIVSKTTITTILPVHSLQTTGIYSYTRNPMYLGLLCIYCGIAFMKGNWWTFILVPLLIFVVQLYIIRREEHYLQRAFGEEYNLYKKSVRRWI